MRVIVLLGLLLVLQVWPGAASGVRVELPSGGTVLTAGEFVELHWHGLPDAVDEMELLLDIAGNDQLIVRLTPQLGPATRRFLWQVPNLPSTAARLRLRWGRGGVETEGAPGTPFVIRADLQAPVASIEFHEGEWWLDDRLRTGWSGSERARVIGALPEHALVASLSELSEVSPHEVECRQPRVARREPWRAGSRANDLAIAAHCPLTIPLRP